MKEKRLTSHLKLVESRNTEEIPSYTLINENVFKNNSVGFMQIVVQAHKKWWVVTSGRS